MPSETPRMPYETHQRLVGQGGNGHLPLLSGEVAWMHKSKMARSRDARIFLSGTVVGVIVLVASLAFMMNQ